MGGSQDSMEGITAKQVSIIDNAKMMAQNLAAQAGGKAKVNQSKCCNFTNLIIKL